MYIYDFCMMALCMGICVVWYDPNIKPSGKRPDIEIGMRR
jgi:hypothetical protein